MRKLLLILTFIFIIPHVALAVVLKEQKTFKDWSVFSAREKFNKKTCYAIATPYRTRALSILRNLPYFTVKYIGKDAFTLSLTSGFILSPEYGVVLEVNDRAHRIDTGLDAMKWTSSYVQDNAILNDLTSGADYFTIRSFGEDHSMVLDYYSLRGFEDSLKYMMKFCK